MSSFLSYNDSINVIAKTISANKNVLNNLVEYFSDVTVSFEKLLKNISEIPKKFDEATQVKTTESEFYMAWMELLQNQICNVSNFEEQAKQIRSNVAESLKSASDDYAQKANIIVQRGKDLIGRLKKSEDAKAEAYKAYEQAGKDLQKAFQAKSPQLEELRENFVETQKKAVQLHEQNNNERISSSLSFERILSDFESLEIRRIESIRNALLNFAKAMHEVAEGFKENAAEFDKKLEEADPGIDINNLVFPKEVKNAIADDKFQIISVPTQVSKIVDKSVLFKSEVANGAKLMKANADFEGAKDELNVSKNEVVAVISDDETRALCHNVNESEGYIPLSILSPID